MADAKEESKLVMALISAENTLLTPSQDAKRKAEEDPTSPAAPKRVKHTESEERQDGTVETVAQNETTATDGDVPIKTEVAEPEGITDKDEAGDKDDEEEDKTGEGETELNEENEENYEENENENETGNENEDENANDNATEEKPDDADEGDNEEGGKEEDDEDNDKEGEQVKQEDEKTETKPQPLKRIPFPEKVRDLDTPNTTVYKSSDTNKGHSLR